MLVRRWSNIEATHRVLHHDLSQVCPHLPGTSSSGCGEHGPRRASNEAISGDVIEGGQVTSSLGIASGGRQNTGDDLFDDDVHGCFHSSPNDSDSDYVTPGLDAKADSFHAKKIMAPCMRLWNLWAQGFDRCTVCCIGDPIEIGFDCPYCHAYGSHRNSIPDEKEWPRAVRHLRKERRRRKRENRKGDGCSVDRPSAAVPSSPCPLMAIIPGQK